MNSGLQKSEHLTDLPDSPGAGSSRNYAMPTYGYARVSTVGQELDIQLAHLHALGCVRIFCEKESGAKDDRRELRRMLRVLRPGDVVIVTALDRLTRGGPFKMLSVLNEITSRRAAYKSLAEPWADTTHELGEVLAALVGYIARKTRDDIVRRTTAGRERARANGVRFGRPPKLSPFEQQQVLGKPGTLRGFVEHKGPRAKAARSKVAHMAPRSGAET
jgi:DNA invertase Pin-like site-specific DNA recombinase